MPDALREAVRQEIWRQRSTGTSRSEMARNLAISRKSVTRILARGVEGLTPRYARCGRNGREYAEAVRAAAISLKRDHPGWGAQVIQLELKTREGNPTRLPGKRTLQNWFRTAGVVLKREHKPASVRTHGRRVHEGWEIDAKEQVTLGEHSTASVMMAVDEASGALVAAASFPPRALHCCPCDRGPRRAPGHV